MDLKLNTEFLSSPLVMWIRTFTVAALADLTELADGHLLNKIMTEIDPTFFGMSFVYSSVCGDVRLRVHNLEQLLKGMKEYYQKRLQQMIVMDLPDIFIIANDPECAESIQELGKILLLILGCAVQPCRTTDGHLLGALTAYKSIITIASCANIVSGLCERKEYFIEKITSLDETIQQELVLHIKEITEKCDKVFTFQPNEIADLSHEELLSFCEDMYDQMIKIIDQRDYHAEELHPLLLDKFYPTKEINGNIQRVNSPPTSPRNSEIVLAEKNKVRQLTEELDEKQLLIQELKEELELDKSLTQKLIQENKTLMEKTRLFNDYRDQMDVLHIQVERNSKLEGDVTKYKEKLREMEGLKKRTEELEEQNDILYSTKEVLQKQVTTLTSKAERLGQTEGEIAKLKANIKTLTEEKRVLESRHENALEENAKLLLEAQNSFSEVTHLSSALTMVKEKEATGTCFASEYNQISSTKLLRLENENHRLKVLIGELTQYKVSGVPQEVVEENATYERTTDDVLVTIENHQVGSVESLARTRTAFYTVRVLESEKKESEKMKHAMEEKDNEVFSLSQRIQSLLEQIAVIEKRLDEVISERQKSEEIVRKKTRELNELNNRIEIILLEKAKFVDNCSAKDKELTNLENRLQRVHEANTDLAEILESKREKISNQEKRLEEAQVVELERNKLAKSFEEQKKRIAVLESSLDDVSGESQEQLCDLRLKENKVKDLEERVRVLECESKEIEKIKNAIEKKDNKVFSLSQRIKSLLEQIAVIENSVLDVEVLNKQNQKLKQVVQQKEGKIRAMDEKMDEYEEATRKCERLTQKVADREERIRKLNERQDISFVTGNQKDIDGLNEKIGNLEKKNDDLNMEKESEAIGFASLRGEKESLVRELETSRSAYDLLINDLADLKDSYTELDLSSAKSVYRCEMLTQMNSTLEEENKMLMEQMNKLLTQNQELLVESLVSRDQFMEEERTFSDRLYELRRQKEKLEEKIEQANRRLAENTPKKKSNLFKKVLQKAGLKKKKDETPNNKTAVQLIKYDHSPGEPELGLSDVSAESGTGFPDVYPLPERASNSSNFSGSVNSDNSPERDLSPLFRRRPKISRAHRSRVARSEYNSPALINALAAHGRSRSLDTKEFAREVLQARGSGPEEESPALVATKFTTVNHDDRTPSNVDNSRQVTRNESFNLGGEARQPNNPIHSRKKSVENKPQVNKPVVNNAALATTTDKASASPKLTGHITSINVRTSSDASRKSSDMSSSHSRSSSLCSADASSDTSKTTVRHVGSTSSSSGLAPTMASEQKIAKTGFINSEVNDSGRENNGKDELRLSSGSGDSTGNEKQTRACRHKTPSPPPRMSVAVDRTDNKPPPSYPTVKNTEIFEDKPPTKRSNSFAERSHSPSVTTSHVQRQNSDRVLTSLHEADRRSLVYSNSTPTNATRDNLRRFSSADQRLSSSGTQAGHATAQSIGIVSFKEVPRVQSAVLESSPLLEKKKFTDVELKTSGHSSVEKNAPKEVSSSPGSLESQTATGLRRTSKLENLLFEGATLPPKKERVPKTSPLWFEYGEV